MAFPPRTVWDTGCSARTSVGTFACFRTEMRGGLACRTRVSLASGQPRVWLSTSAPDLVITVDVAPPHLVGGVRWSHGLPDRPGLPCPALQVGWSRCPR